MQCTVLNKSWKQLPTKQQSQYDHLQTIQINRVWLDRHCHWSKDKHISDVFWWTPKHESSSVCWLANTYIHQLCVDTGCRLEELPRAVADREREREREREYKRNSHCWHSLIMMIYFFLRKTFLSTQEETNLPKCLALKKLNLSFYLII